MFEMLANLQSSEMEKMAGEISSLAFTCCSRKMPKRLVQQNSGTDRCGCFKGGGPDIFVLTSVSHCLHFHMRVGLHESLRKIYCSFCQDLSCFWRDALDLESMESGDKFDFLCSEKDWEMMVTMHEHERGCMIIKLSGKLSEKS